MLKYILRYVLTYPYRMVLLSGRTNLAGQSLKAELKLTNLEPGKNVLCRGRQSFFVLRSMISHPGIAAWYENEVKGNKEDIAYITQARSHVTFKNSAKEVKNLKLQENRMAPLGFTQTSVFTFLGTSSHSGWALAAQRHSQIRRSSFFSGFLRPPFLAP